MTEPDFSGYATRNGLKCSDGRTIMSDAFKHNDKTRVPLVWQHQHNEPSNVLGHALLENRKDGVYAYAFFNDTENAQSAKSSVRHGDITALSIYANNLSQSGKNVLHGDIREVSLVLSGANPGALIDNVNLMHGDSVEVLDDEAVIFTGLTLEHAGTESEGEDVATEEETKTENKDEGKTVKDVFDSLTEEQKNVVYYMIGEAIEDSEDDDDDSAEHSDNSDSSAILQHIQEGFDTMTRNVFENGTNAGGNEKNTLSHDQLSAILTDAAKIGSLGDSMLAHAGDYGIDDIDTLFPDAKAIQNSPELISRRMEWVSEVLTKTKHSPFSRIKTVVADITAEEARARGYVKGNLKKNEVIKLLKRKTEPTTIYKKQKLDRDDILDITDLDVVAWLKGEMRLMLDEELARAILLGDGREASDDDKIDEDRIRPIATDDDMYSHQVALASNASVEDRLEALIRARSNYKGSGQPTFFTTLPFLTDVLLHKDKVGRRIYETTSAIASALMVDKIVPVEAMEQDNEVVGIFVNLSDYTVGADKGGAVSMFDDFDIDYNQNKYLMETRVSGALTKPKSAVVVRREAGIEVTPTSPSFDGGSNTITIPVTAGVEYLIDSLEQTGDVVIDEDTQVDARPASGYSFPRGTVTNWTFVYSV